MLNYIDYYTYWFEISIQQNKSEKKNGSFENYGSLVIAQKIRPKKVSNFRYPTPGSHFC